MSISRIKNLILLILAICALGLMMVVVPQRLTQDRQQRQVLAELKTLYASYDLSLDLAKLPGSARLYSVELSGADALAAARSLLGQDAAVVGSEDRYETEYTAAGGVLRVTRNGGFHAELSDGDAVRDREKEVLRLLRTLGYPANELQPARRGEDQSVTIRAEQKLLGVPIFGGALDFVFRADVLEQIDGTFYMGGESPTRVSQTQCISCADALTQLLASRDALGWVGSRVLSAEQGYLPTETASASVRFVPTWYIETDTGSFYVNGVTREVRPLS